MIEVRYVLKPMHIVHLETGQHLYGGARQVLMLLDGLAREGVQTTLVCPPDSAISTAADVGVTNVVTLPMRGDLDITFASRFGRWLKQAQPDLLHVHSRRGADLWGGLAANRTGVPAVLTRRVDNPELPLLGALKYRAYKRVIAISGAIRQQLVTDGVGTDRIRVIRSVIQPEDCQPDWSRAQFLDAFGLTEEHKAVVCAAQFIPRKGHADLLAAWPAVVAACPQARLILFGQGPDEQALRKVVQQAGLEATVQFAGFRNDLRHFLGRADVLVHPALQEGLGICLLEAQAARVPVVATRAGGIPEAVSEGDSAILVPPSNPLALAGTLGQLLADSELRARMGTAGFDYVSQKFSPQAMVSGNLGVYQELLGSTGKG
jgi:glycosyltransferase involved in cell wall biosynthesis